MKITAIEDIHLYYLYPEASQFRYGGGLCTGRLTCLIRVHTDTGITGIGSCYPHPGMTVRTASGRVTDDAAVEPGVDRYLLRWETLRTNRDQPRDEIPPPSELRLYALGSED